MSSNKRFTKGQVQRVRKTTKFHGFSNFWEYSGQNLRIFPAEFVQQSG